MEFRCISYNLSEARELAARMAGADLSAVHFGDVVRDFLTELYYRRLKVNGLTTQSDP